MIQPGLSDWRSPLRDFGRLPRVIGGGKSGVFFGLAHGAGFYKPMLARCFSIMSNAGNLVDRVGVHQFQ